MSQQVASPEVRELIGRLDAAVRQGGVEAVTESVREALIAATRAGSLRLPARFRRPGATCYARRLLHRNPDLGYTAVVMTWGPRQCTPLHDHAGMWCVEVVVQGEMHVRRFDLREEVEDLFRLSEVEQVRAGVGSSGSLIPPFDYHVLENALPDRTSITLHVYGGEMDHCFVFTPRSGEWYERREKRLFYDE